MTLRIQDSTRISSTQAPADVAATAEVEGFRPGIESTSGFDLEAGPAAVPTDAGAAATALDQHEALGVFSPGALLRGADIHRSQPGDPIEGGDSPNLTAPGQDLTVGSQGAAVQQLQADLVALGYMSQADMNTGPGIFGPKTKAALSRFQESHGIHGNGGVNYGPQTRAALRSALSGAQPAPAPAPTPAPAQTGVPSVDLQRGATGSQVQLLQSDLVHLGYMSQADMNTGPGIFGAHTEAAVRAFQAAYGLPTTGFFGPMSRAKMAEALNGAAPAPHPPPSSGGDASGVARQYLGRNISDLKYNSGLDLDKWPGNDVCCANFVSACLEQVGKLPANQHNDSVHGLVNNLRADGWTEIPLSQAQPGDVVTFDGPEGPGQHVELFNAWVNGQPQYIGSNNRNADGSQKITYDTGSWAYHVHVYHQP